MTRPNGREATLSLPVRDREMFQAWLMKNWEEYRWAPEIRMTSTDGERP